MYVSIILHKKEALSEEISSAISKGLRIGGAECVKTMSVDYVDSDFIKSSHLIVFGSCAYAGSCSWQLINFLETTEINLENKIGGVFVTENVLGSKTDITELKMIAMLLNKGMIICAPGFLKGFPVINFHTLLVGVSKKTLLEHACVFGAAMAGKTLEILESLHKEFNQKESSLIS